jgi:hypothetical protein
MWKMAIDFGEEAFLARVFRLLGTVVKGPYD